MQTKSESRTLLEAYESVRALSKFFFGMIGDSDIHKSPVLEGVKFNNIHWIIAHLAWSENMLILKAVGNIDSGIPWLEEYAIDSDPDEIRTKPDLPELIRAIDSIHEQAKEVISGLTDADLDSDNELNISFGKNKSKRVIIQHAIRHEPMHIGQLSWLLKLSGKETV